MTSDSGQTLRDADAARAVLEAPLLQEAFTDLEQAYVEALLACEKEDDLGRFRLSEGMKVVRLVRRHLESYVEAGALTMNDIQELRRGRKGIW
ncbi:MAG: hypothetical protein RIF37_00555 [Rhodospirillaceae bacterium]